MATRIELVLDCADGERLAAFWTEALGYRRLGSAGAYIALVPVEGDTPKLILQQVAEPKGGKNRMHLDMLAPDIEAEAQRLIALGAQRLRAEVVVEHGTQWIVMADPEGNEFCVCQA